MHRSIEARHTPEHHFARILEVGGNRGEHIPYVNHQFDQYVLTDLYPPRLSFELLKDPRLSTLACDVTALPFQAGQFDRVISTCLLHHVSSPWRAVAEMRRVTRPRGLITILIPTDPGLAYRAGKAITSGRRARRAGAADEFRLISAIDHRNHFRSIRVQLRHALNGCRLRWYWRPFRMESMALNAFAVVEAVLPSNSQC